MGGTNHTGSWRKEQVTEEHRLRTARIQCGCGGDKKEGQEGGGTYNVCED